MSHNAFISNILSTTDREDLIRYNSLAREKDIAWFSRVLDRRIKLYFNPAENKEIPAPEPPELEKDNSLYAALIRHFNMTTRERLVLIISLLPHLRPEALDLFFTRNSILDRGYTEFGGITGLSHSGFLPTGETAMFLISGGNFENRFQCMDIFSREHFFIKPIF